jgi:hypothetical protein
VVMAGQPLRAASDQGRHRVSARRSVEDPGSLEGEPHSTSGQSCSAAATQTTDRDVRRVTAPRPPLQPRPSRESDNLEERVAAACKRISGLAVRGGEPGVQRGGSLSVPSWDLPRRGEEMVGLRHATWSGRLIRAHGSTLRLRSRFRWLDVARSWRPDPCPMFWLWRGFALRLQLRLQLRLWGGEGRGVDRERGGGVMLMDCAGNRAAAKAEQEREGSGSSWATARGVGGRVSC